MPLTIDVELSSAPETGSAAYVAIPVAKVGEELVLATPFAVSLGVLDGLDGAELERRRFEAKAGSSLIYVAAPGAPTLLLVGLGDSPEEPEAWRQAAATTVRHAQRGRAVLLGSDDERCVEGAVVGGMLASYRYGLRSTEDPRGPERLVVATHAESGLESGRAIAGAVALARDLINSPPSALTPSILAADALALLGAADRVEVEVWEEGRIASERLGGLLGVAAGSSEPPRLLLARYEPAGESSRHVVLVGKGITFDSGGLSLKTAGGMTTMKTDMSGAAIVLAAMTALAALEVDVRVTAIAPMSENMPGSAAMKPGDVLTARSGTTIEVLNTDAEGRLILADALCLAVEEEPDLMIDVATLTGAATVALGREVGALLANDDEVAEELLAASRRSGEKLWRLPLVEEYEGHIASEVADIKNVGAAGEAGTISAALFLQRFVDKRPWAHLDIAGPGRSEKDTGYLSKGGTAFGLMAILDVLRASG
jgi:leucyl aminopeptidase